MAAASPPTWCDRGSKGGLDDEEIVVPSTPIEWVYSKDAARGVWLACWAEPTESRVFNVSIGEMPGPDELVADLRSLFPDIRHRVAEMSVVLHQTEPSDLRRSRAELGFEPEYPMREAFEDYLRWVVDHRH